MFFNKGDIVTFKIPLAHPTDPAFNVRPGIKATVMDQVDYVVMVLPHNAGHEMIVRADEIEKV